METAQCPVCGQDDVKVRKDETLYAHQADGAKCEGSGLAPAAGAEGAVLPEREAVPGGWLPEVDESAYAPDAKPLDPATLDLEPTPARPEPGGFAWRLTVKAPCPYLDDAAWHQANAQLAIKRATRAGHTVTGQARHTRTEEGWGTVTLTYTVTTQ